MSALLFVLRGVFKNHYWMIDEQNPDIFWKKGLLYKSIKGIKHIRTLDKENTAGCLQQICWEYLDKEDFHVVLTKGIVKFLSHCKIISRD